MPPLPDANDRKLWYVLIFRRPTQAEHNTGLRAGAICQSFIMAKVRNGAINELLENHAVLEAGTFEGQEFNENARPENIYAYAVRLADVEIPLDDPAFNIPPVALP